MEQSYKEKYEQAIERLKQWDREHPCGSYVLSDRDNFIFPELKESCDEKMRKAIKEALSSKQAEDIIESKYKIKMVDVSDWLEKQGQVKESTISQHEIETCKENDDSLTSEDERIRKEIINYFQCQSEEEPTRKEIHDKWIAWLENIPYTIDHEKREGFHLGYKACLEKQGEQKFEMKTAEESLGIDSDTYNKIVDECIFGEQNPADSYCQENCKGYQETGKCFADGECKAKREAEQNLAENAKPQSSTPMSYGKELEKRMCEACNRFFAPNTDSNRYSASDLFYAGVKAERDLNTLAWSEKDEPQKELAKSYLAKFDEKFPILPTLKGKRLADYKNFLNKCQQIFGLKYWGIRPTQAKLFEKLSLLWAAWGAEHLQGLGQTDGDMDDEISMWSEEDEENFCSVYLDVKSARQNTVNSLSGDLKEQEQKRMDEVISWLESIKNRVQPKQEWTEEEIEPIISDYLCGREHYGGMIGRLCHLKPKQKQTEWSENDKAFLDDILCKLEHDLILNKDEKDWLKSLRPQNKWKPSDEQIAQLQIVVDTYGNEGIYDPILTELLFQLKKIKGEV